MKLIICHDLNGIQQLDEFKEVEMVEFEDQTEIGNGSWLHVTTKTEQFSIEFTPTEDAFRITKE